MISNCSGENNNKAQDAPISDTAYALFFMLVH